MKFTKEGGKKRNSKKYLRPRPEPPNKLQSNLKSSKPKKATKHLLKGTVLTPTSSSLFFCEPVKECSFNNPTEELLKRNNTTKFNWDSARNNISKVKPYRPNVVKLSKPLSNNHNELKRIINCEQQSKSNEGEIKFLKSLTTVTDISCDAKRLTVESLFGEKKSCEKTNNHKAPSFIRSNHCLEKKSIQPNTTEHKGFENGNMNSTDIIVSNSCNTLNKEISKVYRINNSKFLLSMKPGMLLHFVGALDLELLSGCVEILGYCVNKFQKNILKVYSFQGSSHLFIKSGRKRTLDIGESIDNIEDLPEKLVSLGLSNETATRISEEKGNSVFLLTKCSDETISSVWPIFIEHHLSFSVFPPVDLLRKESRLCHNMEHGVGCIFQESLQDLGFKEFNEISEWNQIEQDIFSSENVFKNVLCGGKSVGKSTLLRYLVNKCLQSWGKALVIDCDLGQCEFTPPGCISATIVDQPLLGPNYTHLKDPLRCVHLGEVDVTKCPESYIEGYKWLIEYAKKEHDQIPWLINTMGFTRGFGLKVACDIINNVNPTHVVQIESKDRKLNFPERLEPGYVYSQNTDAFSRQPECVDYRLHVVPSGSESGNAGNSRGLSPAESRNLVILSYLSGMLKFDALSLSQVVPYVINMDMLELQIVNKYTLNKAQIAAAMNGNLVALCVLTDSDSFPNCLGFGIVRAIDWQTNSMYLMTPMAAGSLQKVNCLQKGNIALPESLYFNQGGVEGRVPYLALTSGSPTARYARRDFRSLPVTPASATSS